MTKSIWPLSSSDVTGVYGRTTSFPSIFAERNICFPIGNPKIWFSEGSSKMNFLQNVHQYISKIVH